MPLQLGCDRRVWARFVCGSISLGSRNRQRPAGVGPSASGGYARPTARRAEACLLPKAVVAGMTIEQEASG